MARAVPTVNIQFIDETDEHEENFPTHLPVLLKFMSITTYKWHVSFNLCCLVKKRLVYFDCEFERPGMQGDEQFFCTLPHRINLCRLFCARPAYFMCMACTNICPQWLTGCTIYQWSTQLCMYTKNQKSRPQSQVREKYCNTLGYVLIKVARVSH